MSEDKLDTAERTIIEHIMLLKRDHEKHLEPLYRRLAEIRSLRPPPPIFIEKDHPLALAIQQQKIDSGAVPKKDTS